MEWWQICLIGVAVVLVIVLIILVNHRKKKSLTLATTETVKGKYLWKDRRRVFLGLPWTFDRYRLTKEKLLLVSGFFTLKEEEVKLYRVLDLSLTRTLGQRLLGIGTVTVKSNDKSLPVVILKNIKFSKQVKELISDLVEAERLAKKVGSSEMMGLHDHAVDVDGDGIPDMPECPDPTCDVHH